MTAALTAETFAWGVLFVSLCGASITGIILAAKWALAREQARRTWHIAENADVARAQADNDAVAELEVICEELGEALAGLRRSA